MGIIIYTWPENYGDPSKSKTIVAQFQQPASAITSDEKIALLGAIQSLFEASMYTFVFLWTPALSPNKQAIPHGFIFTTFMLASMLGSSLASCLLARIDLKVESYTQLVFLVAASSLCLPVLTTHWSEMNVGVVIACMMLDGRNDGPVHCMISMKLDLVL
ncbi:unnamed protein product [Sphagnum balticum]